MWEKENQALLRKNYQKSRPKIMSADLDQLQRKWSLLKTHVIWMDI